MGFFLFIDLTYSSAFVIGTIAVSVSAAFSETPRVSDPELLRTRLARGPRSEAPLAPFSNSCQRALGQLIFDVV